MDIDLSNIIVDAVSIDCIGSSSGSSIVTIPAYSSAIYTDSSLVIDDLTINRPNRPPLQVAETLESIMDNIKLQQEFAPR